VGQDEGQAAQNPWAQRIISGGAILILVLLFLVGHKSNDLADTQRYSRFQTYL